MTCATMRFVKVWLEDHAETLVYWYGFTAIAVSTYAGWTGSKPVGYVAFALWAPIPIVATFLALDSGSQIARRTLARLRTKRLRNRPDPDTSSRSE